MNEMIIKQAFEAIINPINVVFIALIFWLFFTTKGNLNKSIFTTIGMLGTFVGIAIGLLGFKPDDITGSMPDLLAGLKTAMITSIFGMIASLLYLPVWKKFKKDALDTGTDIEILLAATENNTRTIKDGLEKLVLAMGGDQDNSLVSQIKTMRVDINDGNKKLQKSFEDFAEKVSKASTEELVKALKEVISSFNEKITDQFGENFKHLNAGVEKLVIWQEQYKNHIEEVQNRLDISIASINKTELSLTNIEEKTSLLPQNLESLEKILTIQKDIVADLEEKLKSFASMKEQAINAMPIIQDNLDKLTTEFQQQIKTSISNISNDFTKISSTFSDGIRTEINSIENEKKELVAEFNKAIIDSEKSRNELTKSFNNALSESEKARTDLTKAIESISEGVKNQIELTNSQLNELLNGVFVNYSESMETQMTDIINNMGTQLTSISSHLASDYETFTVNFSKAVDKIKDLNNSGV